VPATAYRRATAVPLPTVRTVAGYRRAVEAARRSGATLGVVPTMGALHAGHRSLIERAAADCDVVVVTIFVNPTQFGEAADLASYPRTPITDLEVAARSGASFAFVPAVTEMYPDGLCTVPLPAATTALGRRLEGRSRPGHFDGVATVVPRLLAPAGPCRAYFGEKDFQQLALVRLVVGELGLPVDVVGCDTVRDPDGLALSSRNVRLSARERQAALVLSHALAAGARSLSSGAVDASAVEVAMAGVVAGEPSVELDYAVLVRADTLEAVDRLDSTSLPLRLLVAATVGGVRLIDNLDPRRPLPDELSGPDPGRS
ncbi:MAG TPA: pantoate--beta-alanine ligase, partial [Acidimicrobiales bacterium]|nr:pantoate--beta-alanine ligase [Acidimicrobiales bacterium]